MSLLAETQMNAGDHTKALDSIAESQSFADQRDERYWEAERLRLRGEISKVGDQDRGQAETYFREAMETARAQKTLSLHLRAAVSLARLLIESERAPEARSTLEPVYQSFTEGFDTPDLVAARQLLDSID